MARAPRSFAVKPAKRELTPLFVGLFGPSGGGKTYSALELATGIQSVVGGKIVGIDTENRRMLHYADKFDFEHIDFQPPFGSLDYADAIKFAVDEYKAKTIIIDSMSHEHEGEGGLLRTHEAEVERMSGGDYKKAERINMLAWNKPKQNRRALLNTILRANANLICCFRAKDTSKPVKGEGGKQEVVSMGYMPIAGEEFVFEMTVAALLLPGAKGLPTFYPENPGERAMVKLTEDFEWLAERAAKGGKLDRKVGAALARWAQGVDQSKEPSQSRSEEPGVSGRDEPETRGEPAQGGENRQFDDNPPPPSDDDTGYQGV